MNFKKMIRKWKHTMHMFSASVRVQWGFAGQTAAVIVIDHLQRIINTPTVICYGNYFLMLRLFCCRSLSYSQMQRLCSMFKSTGAC